MAKRYFETEDGQRYGFDEENVAAALEEAKTRGMKVKEIADPTQKEPEAQPKREEYSFFKDKKTGDKYRIKNSEVDAALQEAREKGMEVEPWNGKENLGVYGTMKAEAEAKAGRKMGFWGTVTTRLPFIASVVASYDAKRRKREADFTFGNFKDAQEMLDRSRFLSPEMREKMEATIRAAGGEISGGRVIGTPDFERVKATMSEAMKPEMVETIKTQKDAEARLERNELSTWQKIGKGTIEGGKMVSEFATPTGMMASAFLGAFNRFEELTEDTYDLDQNGNPVLVHKGDVAGAKAAAEAGLGAAAEYLIWNRIPGIGKLFGKAIEGLEKIPGVAALTSGAARFTAKSVGNLIGKLQGNQGGRILMKTGEVLGQLWDKTKVGSLPTMVMKSRMTEFVDDVMGLRRQEKESEDFAKWWEKITSKEENVELLLGIIGVHMGMAGIAGAKGAWATKEYRTGAAAKRGEEILGREELVKEFAGEELAKKLSNEDLGRIFDLAVKCENNPEKVEAFLNRLKEDQVEGQRLIDEGRNVEEVMNGLRQKMANGEKLEEAAEALKKKLEEGEAVGVGGSVGERVAEFLDRYMEGRVEIRRASIDDLKTAEERIGGEAEKGEGAVDSPVVIFEAADGTRELITGKKRVAAAWEKGEKEIDARIVREKEGWTLEEAREINTLENLREGHLGEQATLEAVDRLGIKDPLELELLGVDGERAENAVKTLQEASDATREAMIKGGRGKAVEATRMLFELTRETMGEKRDAAQRVMLERVVGKMDPTTAREIARVLRERADSIDFTDPRAVEEAIAEGRRRAKEEVEVDQMLVEMKDGSVKTIGEIKAEHAKRLEELEKKDREDETPLWDKAQSADANRGVRLEVGANGVRSCSRFPEVKVQVQKEGVVVEGVDIEKLTRPENIEDAAALVERLTALSEETGLKIVVNDAKARAGLKEIADTIKMEGEKAYSVEQRNLRMGVIKTLAEATGRKCHTSARDWEWVMNQTGVKAWSSSSRGVYGAYYKGEVYLNPTTFRVGAPIHEYGHATIEIVRGVNEALINRGLELVGKDEWSKAKLAEIKADDVYGSQDEATLREEVLTHLIEMKGEKLVNEKGIGAELKAWIKEVWAALKGYTGLESLTEEKISKMTLDEIASRLTEEMLSGRRIGEAKSEGGAKFGRYIPQTRPGGYEAHDYNGKRYGNAEYRRKDMGAFVEWDSVYGGISKGSKGPNGEVIPDARYSRPWPKEMPGVYVHRVIYHDVHNKEQEWYKLYEKGKRGDAKAAYQILSQFVNKELTLELAKKYPNALLAPVMKPTMVHRELMEREGSGINANPAVLASIMSKITNGKLDWTNEIRETSSNFNGKTRKGDTIETDLLTPIDFGGRVEKGREYILVDDNMRLGTTFSSMRQFIEENGGKVVACVALTHNAAYGKIFRITEQTKDKLYEVYRVGNEKREETLERISEALRRANIAGGVDALTDGQGTALRYAKAQGRRIFGGNGERISSRYDEGSAWNVSRELGQRAVRWGKRVGKESAIDGDVFVANDGLRIVAEGDVEGSDAGLRAGRERSEALRPWTKEGSPAAEAKPIAMDLADLVGFIRQITGKNPSVTSTSDVEGYSTRDKITLATRIFGVLEEGDKARLKVESEKAGYWKHEDPEWEANHDLAEVRRMRRLSEIDLSKRTHKLFEKRVKTGEGGERRAAMVMAKELGHVLLWQRADGSHSTGVAMGLKVIDELVRGLDGKKNEGLRKEIERTIAWWHGAEECPEELKAKKEMGAEIFGILLTAPEALAEKSPKTYAFVRDLFAKNEEVASAYRKFCEMKWNGKADTKLEKELDAMWDKENTARIAEIEKEVSKGSDTFRERFIYALHDQFGPMFMIAKRSLKALSSKFDRQVERGLLTRDEANRRIKDEEERIKSLRSGLQDFQRQSDGTERMMIGEFADVMRRAKEAGVNWRGVRRYAHLMRVIEIGGRATAYGVDPARAAKLLERLKAAVGDEQYKAIEGTWQQFRGVYEKFVLEDRRVMEMFNPATRAMLWKNTHYVTMRHTLSPEEAKAYEEELKRYKEGVKTDPTMADPTLDIYRRLNHGLGEQETEAGFEMKRLYGSFEAVEDPIAATIKRAIEIKRAAAKNELVRNLRDVLVGTEAKDVIDKYSGTVQHNGKLGALSYMEGGKVYKLVLPAIIERSFKAKNEWEGMEEFGATMRFLKNTMTVWNPAFRNRAYLIDKAALEANLEGMHKDFVGVIAGMIPFGRVPMYAIDNYVTRHTNFAKTWIGKILYNEHTVNYYAKDAADIARWIYRNELGGKLEEAQKLREEGRTGEAAEIEEKLRIAKSILSHNVLQSQYKFDKIQRAQSPEQILEAYGLNRTSIEGLKGVEKAKEGAKRGWETWNRWGEEQEAVTKLIAWMYDEKMNPGGSEMARARLVIEQGGTPDLGVRGVFAAHLENATGFFWNVRKNAAIRTYKAFRDHPTEWATKAAVQTLLPAMAKGLASVGILNLVVKKFLFDDDEEKMYGSALGPVMKYWDWYGKAMQWIPGYQQRNYNVIPLWTPGDGGCFAMRIKYAPEEFAIVNAVHAVVNSFGPRPTDASANLQTAIKGVMDEILPERKFSNPVATLLEIALAPLTGYNPHDDFRNRDIYSRDAMLAGWTKPYAWKEMGINLWNYSPLGNFFMGIPDPKETGAAPIPKGLGALLNGVPLLSRLPASVLGFYADPSKGGLIQGAKAESAQAVALAKLRAGDVLARCFADGNLLRIDRHVYDVAGAVEGFDRIQIYKFVQMGWRKFMIQRAYGPIGGLYKEANRIQAPTSRLKAIELINQACREDD